MRLTWLVLAVVCWLVQPLHAKPKVAIVAIDGDKKGEAREMVSDTLGDDVTVLGSKQVNRTIDDLGFDSTALGEKELRKLSKELEADAIIQAKLSTKGKDKLLHFKLFVHGKKEKGFKVEFGSLKSERFKQKLHDKLLEKLGYATPPDDEPLHKTKPAGDDGDATPPPTKTKTKKPKPAAGDDDDATPPPTKTKKVPAGDDDDAAANAKLLKSHPKPKGGDDDDATATPAPTRVAHAGDDDDDASVTAHVVVARPAEGPSGRSANRDAVRVDLGMSASNRNLSFNSRQFTNAPKGYSNSVVPGVRIAGEIYPFAFGNPDGIAAGIGLGGLYDKTLLLSLATSIQMGTRFPVDQYRYSFGPRFRILFGHHETSPSLTIGVGYGHRTFSVDRTALLAGNTLDIPDVDYRGYDPTLELRLPFSKRIAMSFGAGAILLSGAGQIQTQAQYGQATVTGGEGDLSVDILITERVGLKIGFDAAQIGFQFKGNGVMTVDRDGDPTTKDVGGAADRYLGAAATVSVMY
jgi:hypothetical protein